MIKLKCCFWRVRTCDASSHCLSKCQRTPSWSPSYFLQYTWQWSRSKCASITYLAQRCTVVGSLLSSWWTRGTSTYSDSVFGWTCRAFNAREDRYLMDQSIQSSWTSLSFLSYWQGRNPWWMTSPFWSTWWSSCQVTYDPVAQYFRHPP